MLRSELDDRVRRTILRHEPHFEKFGGFLDSLDKAKAPIHFLSVNVLHLQIPTCMARESSRPLQQQLIPLIELHLSRTSAFEVGEVENYAAQEASRRVCA